MTKPKFKPVVENKFVKFTTAAYEKLLAAQGEAFPDEDDYRNLFQVVGERTIGGELEYEVTLYLFNGTADSFQYQVMAKDTYFNRETLHWKVAANIDDLVVMTQKRKAELAQEAQEAQEEVNG